MPRRRTETSPSGRVPLSRDRVLAAAVALADRSGIGALTIRSLAEAQAYLAHPLLGERLREFSDLPLAKTLADATTLRCKANLLTRIDGLDELVGPLETQSVYVDIDNPFAEGETAA